MSYGHRLVTLSLTVNETLQCLSSVPIFNARVILVATEYSVGHILPLPHLSWDFGPRQYLFGETQCQTSLTNQKREEVSESGPAARRRLRLGSIRRWFESDLHSLQMLCSADPVCLMVTFFLHSECNSKHGALL